jgi:hypothetical protein
VEKQTGDWPRVVRYAGVPKDPVELEMFRIGFPHGRSPAGAAYAYAVMPARAPGAPAVRWDSAGFRVVSNTPGVQAVWFSDRQLLQALFRGPGSVTLDGGRQLTVGGACAVQVHVPTGGLWVADPTHQQETVTVEWAGTRWMARLPDGEESGRTERR